MTMSPFEELLDYRRSVAEMYGRLRCSNSSQVARCQAFRRERDWLFATHPQSPLSREQQAEFTGLHYYAYDPAWRFILPVDRDKEKIMLRIETKWSAFLVPAVLLSVAIAVCGLAATPAPVAAMVPVTATANEEVTYVNNGESLAIDSAASNQTLNLVTTGTLSAAEVEGLLYMREEEKLARDVYLTLYEEWGMRIFQNISGSEQTHMDAVRALLDRYDLEDPAVGTVVGAFTNPTLQELYDQLITAYDVIVNTSRESGRGRRF